ncbi:hypothetical protein [Rhizobium croatiense]|uniref:hypothetical protein n=1 Tax=Rhizobium croatiense TaxID=2867516 RepID=UPI0023ED3D87|nr:hypothetical protein [Rhizobium croatiense]WET74102.1 hypothetical protein PYR68_00750 [Rhizobium croatiense]
MTNDLLSPRVENSAGQLDDFDWTGADLESVIIEEQRSIAVYRNKFGSIVIRAEDPDEDRCIVLSSDDAVRALIQALKDEMGGRR